MEEAGGQARQKRRMTERRCRAEVRQLVLESMPEVTRGLIRVAKDGNYNQAKLLAELSGLMDKGGEPSTRERRSDIARLLMSELRRREGEVVSGGQGVG